MKVLMWHVHGSWTTSFVQGDHEVLLPFDATRSEDGRGRARTWEWPERAREVTFEQLADEEIDVVVLQRPRELWGLADRWLRGRRVGVDLPAVYVEHNCPQGRVNDMRHPVADRPEIDLVHVTHFNDLFWDAGPARTRVIRHGVIDPGYRYVGDLMAAAAVINDPYRRGRVSGTDLVDDLSRRSPVHLFGIGAEHCARAIRDRHVRSRALEAFDDVPQDRLHGLLPHRRVYLHPFRWTSLGLSLIEAMLLGMPVAALATTEVCEAVPAGAGVVTNDFRRLEAELCELLRDRDRAAEAGRIARAAAAEQFGLDRFLTDWNELLEEVTS